jgi:hypothetical protein
MDCMDRRARVHFVVFSQLAVLLIVVTLPGVLTLTDTVYDTEGHVDVLLTAKCDIEKVFIDTDTVIDLPDRPRIFVYTDFLNRNRRLREIGTRNYLIEHHGFQEVRLTSSNSYSQGLERMTLGEYLLEFTEDHAEIVEETEVNDVWTDIRPKIHPSPPLSNDTMYLFGGNFDGIIRTLENTYEMPNCKYCKKAGLATVGVGGQNSGVAFHFHGPGFSEAVIGAKKWLIYPGTGFPFGFHSNMSVIHWYQQVLPTLSADVIHDMNLQECDIRPGELLYFPAMYMHATLNIDRYNLFMSVFLDNQLMHD